MIALLDINLENGPVAGLSISCKLLSPGASEQRHSRNELSGDIKQTQMNGWRDLL